VKIHFLIHTGLQPGDSSQCLIKNRFNGFPSRPWTLSGLKRRWNR